MQPFLIADPILMREGGGGGGDEGQLFMLIPILRKMFLAELKYID